MYVNGYFCNFLVFGIEANLVCSHSKNCQVSKISPQGNLLWRKPLAGMSFHNLHLRLSQFWVNQLECHCRLQCRSGSCPLRGPHWPSQFLQQVPKSTEVSGKFMRLKLCQVSMLLSGPNFLLLLAFFFFSFQTMWLCFQVAQIRVCYCNWGCVTCVSFSCLSTHVLHSH